MLGIGGVRALRALGLHPQVFHTNEGHAGFLSLERIRELVESGLTFAEAVEVVRAGGVFTTHTPVPAGIDRFPRDLMEKYFGVVRHIARRHVRRTDVRSARTRRTRRRSIQHGGDGSAARRSQQRRRPVARRRQPRDVPRPVARCHGRGSADRRHHQRRARPHMGQRRHGRPPVQQRRPGVGRCRRGVVGRRRPSWRPRDVWATRAKGRADLVSFVRSNLGEARARSQRIDHRLRSPVRDLQASHAAAVATRSIATAAARRRIVPCSSCSPARPTQRISPART